MPTLRDLLRRRLHNQQLAGPGLREPADVVAWLGAVQAQDYPAAKWGVALRVRNLADPDVERSFNAGAILRTHILRPTWHFVAPADIRWMLALTAPRVHAVNAFVYRQVEIDGRLVARSRAGFEKALRDGQMLTRPELAVALRRVGIRADGLRLAYLVMHAELDQVICSGARRGKQMTYALLDERVPRTRPLPRDEALAELARRYFTSHGPATLRDFVWWSGLTVRDARTSIEAAGPALARMVVGDLTCWHAPSLADPPRGRSSAHLLPNYDEYLIAYKDRDPVTEGAGRDMFSHYVVIDGRLAGTWRRTRPLRQVRQQAGRGEVAAVIRAARAAGWRRFQRPPLRVHGASL
jgi:hypothetical protein